ncbi:MAG TPA: hypothetical protein VKB26_09580, partial [Candidatus Acidoferrales bacterium]|nr:hypothetical protein [Candidatus Acidoferrales bacterium]
MNRRSVLPILAVFAFSFFLSPPAHSQETDTSQQQADQQAQDAQAKAKKKKQKDLEKELLPVYRDWLNGP